MRSEKRGQAIGSCPSVCLICHQFMIEEQLIEIQCFILNTSTPTTTYVSGKKGHVIILPGVHQLP